tara:strand:- start:642 stop:965 length:324 start_codon:yes stop_codon:yes gene_type:complete
MNKKLQSIKKKVQKIRAQKGVKARLPDELWLQISKCCEASSIKDVAAFIGVDANNASRALRKLKKRPTKVKRVKPSKIPELIQIPILPSPILELTLQSGAVIKVFSA